MKRNITRFILCALFVFGIVLGLNSFSFAAGQPGVEEAVDFDVYVPEGLEPGVDYEINYDGKTTPTDPQPLQCWIYRCNVFGTCGWWWTYGCCKEYGWVWLPCAPVGGGGGNEFSWNVEIVLGASWPRVKSPRSAGVFYSGNIFSPGNDLQCNLLNSESGHFVPGLSVSPDLQ